MPGPTFPHANLANGAGGSTCATTRQPMLGGFCIRNIRLAILILSACAIPAALIAQQTPAVPPPTPGLSLDQQRAALARAKTQGEDARKRSEALEARARAGNAAADKTRDQIAALAA